MVMVIMMVMMFLSNHSLNHSFNHSTDIQSLVDPESISHSSFTLPPFVRVFLQPPNPNPTPYNPKEKRQKKDKKRQTKGSNMSNIQSRTHLRKSTRISNEMQCNKKMGPNRTESERETGGER